MNTISIFGQEVNLEIIRVAVTAVNEGFTVTATAVLDNDDVLYAHTVYRKKATVDDAMEMVSEAGEIVAQWLKDNQ